MPRHSFKTEGREHMLEEASPSRPARLRCTRHATARPASAGLCGTIVESRFQSLAPWPNCKTSIGVVQGTARAPARAVRMVVVVRYRTFC
jgi:hypothetical protein